MQPPAADATEVPREAEEMKGPTGYSNWVFLNSLLVGAHPYDSDDLDTILSQGVRLFICLETEKELARSNSYYIERARKMVAGAPKKFTQKPIELEFLHFPINDSSVVADTQLLQLIERIEKELVANKRIFMHCRGGHGRTGTVVSILLGRRFGLAAYDALQLCQAYHDTREDVIMRGLGFYRSPETHEQRDQVYRILK